MSAFNHTTVSSNTAFTTGASNTKGGAGGRRLVQLENGWFVTVLSRNDFREFFVYRPEASNPVWEPLCHTFHSNIDDNGIALQSVGNYVYFVESDTTYFEAYSFDATTVPNQNIYDTQPYFLANLTTNELHVESASLVVNQAGTEIHAAWASKSSAYSKSYNIRYAKGVIGSGGAVAWDPVVQKTTINNNFISYTSASIVLNDAGQPLIACSYQSSTESKLLVLGGGSATAGDINGTYAALSSKSDAYPQLAPSALFVPPSINGLTNGRLWVAYHATESYNVAPDIIASHSDDGGLTWSLNEWLTTGKNMYASLTANSSGKVFVAYERDQNEIQYVTFTGGSWTVEGTDLYTGETGFVPSTLFDPTFQTDFDKPITIYKTATQIAITGVVTNTDISVPVGPIGQKTDADYANLLTYSLTGDEITTVTEKINGVTVGTKTPTSGQTVVMSATQAQWEAVPFGTYRNTTGDPNTIEISMGNKSWSYTFDKRPALGADVLTGMQAIKDANDVHLPSVVYEIADAVRFKGGTLGETPTFADIRSAIENLPAEVGGIKSASGTISVPSGTVQSYTQQTGSSSTATANSAMAEVTGLDFTPSTVVIYSRQPATPYNTMTVYKQGFDAYSASDADVVLVISEGNMKYIVEEQEVRVAYGSFRLPVYPGSFPATMWWNAYE